MGSAPFFDTVRISVGDAGKVVADAAAKGVNLRQLDASTITVALDETTRLEDVDELLAILNGGSAPGFSAESLAGEVCTLHMCAYCIVSFPNLASGRQPVSMRARCALRLCACSTPRVAFFGVRLASCGHAC